MATVGTPIRIFEEIADLIASVPDRDALLAYRPSTVLQERASELLVKNREGTLTADERLELDEFTQAELFMRRIKARLRKHAPEESS